MGVVLILSGNIESSDNFDYHEIKGSSPLYVRLAGQIKSQILQGRYPIGTSLPGEMTLGREFGVSRHTVRAALRQLRDEGLVVSRQGSGTQVIPPLAREEDIHQVMSINDLIAFADDAEFELQEMRVKKLSVEQQQKTGLDLHSSWLQFNGLRVNKENRQPMCRTEYFVHQDYTAIARILSRHRGSVFPLLEDMFSLDISEVEQQVSATLLSDNLAELLEAEPGSAALEVRRRYKTDTGKLVQVTVNTHPASRFKQSMTMRRVRSVQGFNGGGGV